MFTSELTLADRGRFIKLTTKSKSSGKDVIAYGMVAACGHGDPAIEMADGYVYHFNDGDTAEFITEQQAFIGVLAQLFEEE